MSPSFVSSGRHSTNAPVTPANLVSDCSIFAHAFVDSCYLELDNVFQGETVSRWTTSSLAQTPEGQSELEAAFSRWTTAHGYTAKNGATIDWEVQVTPGRVDIHATRRLHG